MDKRTDQQKDKEKNGQIPLIEFGSF